MPQTPAPLGFFVHLCRVRDGVCQEAIVYFTEVLPLASTVVVNISHYFDFYLNLKFDEWKKNLSLIGKKLEDCKEACNLILHLQKIIIRSVKMLEDKAIYSIPELIQLVEVNTRLRRDPEAQQA